MVALLLTLLFSPWLALPPDVLPPGHKSVRHVILLEWDGELEARRFVAHPTRGFDGHHEIEAGQPFTFSSKYGTRIYAVPANAAFPERDSVAGKNWPNAPVPVAQVSSIAAGSPLASVESRVRIERVTAETIEFRVLGERKLDASGNELGDFDWLVLALIAGTGLLCVLMMARRTRAAPTAVT